MLTLFHTGRWSLPKRANPSCFGGSAAAWPIRVSAALGDTVHPGEGKVGTPVVWKNTHINVAHSRQQSKTMTHKQITFRRRACISMLSPQHPFSPGSCVGPLRCGKILHAPGHPWPLSYGRQKLYVFVCVSGGERKGQRQRGRKDDGRNRRRMCFLWFHWQCGTANDFSSNEHEKLPLPAQRLGALFWTIIIFVHRVLFPFTSRPLRNTQLWWLSISL